MNTKIVRPLAFLPLVISLHLASAQSALTPDSPKERRPLTTYATRITEALTKMKSTRYTKQTPPACDTDDAYKIVSIECQNQRGFLLYLKGVSLYHTFLQTAESALTDHQPNSPVGGAGSAGAVTKAAVPSVIGLAVNGGGLTQSTSGVTSTFTGNALGLFRYLTGGEVFPYCPKVTCDKLPARVARRLSGSISLDSTNSASTTAMTSGTTSNPSASTPATSLSGSNWRMSSWGVQFQVPLGSADQAGTDFRKAWDAEANKIGGATPGAKAQAGNKPASAQAGVNGQSGKSASPQSQALQAAAANLNKQLADALDSIETKDTFYKSWQKDAWFDISNLLDSASPPSQDQVETALRPWLDKLADYVLTNHTVTNDQVTTTLNAYDQYFASRDAVIALVQGRLPGLSLAFTNVHPLNEANVMNFKAIFQFQPKKGNVSLTFNGAADVYDSLPAGSTVGRWRDLQFSAQANYTLPSRYDRAVLSGAFYYQYMATKAVLQIPAGNTVPGTNITLPAPAATLLAPAGNIWIAQGLVTFPVKSSTTKIPVGLSYSNRTDLLTGPVLRAHIGVNFDFDSLFMK